MIVVISRVWSGFMKQQYNNNKWDAYKKPVSAENDYTVVSYLLDTYIYCETADSYCRTLQTLNIQVGAYKRNST